MLGSAEHDLLLGLGAFLAALGGCLSAWAGLVKARNEGAEECEKKLKKLREETEQQADELHELRMRKGVIRP